MQGDYRRALLPGFQLVWQATENLTTTLRWEHNETKVDGQATEVVNGQLNLPKIMQRGPLADCLRG